MDLCLCLREGPLGPLLSFPRVQSVPLAAEELAESGSALFHQDS